eukprot:GILK01007792.1.p1 GENE.GILK01007792.1~~GILK01007792.1.p1  ORF type:complete len:440 (-),score=66.46 GILK01007792.1:189-1508(-)
MSKQTASRELPNSEHSVKSNHFIPRKRKRGPRSRSVHSSKTKPRRALSAYTLFLQDHLQNRPPGTPAVINGETSFRWKTMPPSEKAHYYELAVQDRLRYEQEAVELARRHSLAPDAATDLATPSSPVHTHANGDGNAKAATATASTHSEEETGEQEAQAAQEKDRDQARQRKQQQQQRQQQRQRKPQKVKTEASSKKPRKEKRKPSVQSMDTDVTERGVPFYMQAGASAMPIESFWAALSSSLSSSLSASPSPSSSTSTSASLSAARSYLNSFQPLPKFSERNFGFVPVNSSQAAVHDPFVPRASPFESSILSRFLPPQSMHPSIGGAVAHPRYVALPFPVSSLGRTSSYTMYPPVSASVPERQELVLKVRTRDQPWYREIELDAPTIDGLVEAICSKFDIHPSAIQAVIKPPNLMIADDSDVASLNPLTELDLILYAP